MAIALRKPNELTKLAVAGSIVGKTLKHLRENITVGMSLKEIDAMGEAFIREHGAEPKDYMAFQLLFVLHLMKFVYMVYQRTIEYKRVIF